MEDLKKIYRDFIEEKIPASRRKCLSPKKLVKFFEPGVSEKRKSKLLDHITTCRCCAWEFDWILHILRNRLFLCSEIHDLVVKRKENLTAAKKNPGSHRRKKTMFLFPRLSWKQTVLFGSTAVLLAALFHFFTPWISHENRGKSLDRIQLMKPVNEACSVSSLSFKWNEFPGAEYCIFELFDETLISLWKSPPLHSRSHITLADEVTGKLKTNRSYFWMVTVFLPDGKKVESDIENFYLTD